MRFRQECFTLIEMLIVLLIVAALFMVVYPSFKQSSHQHDTAYFFEHFEQDYAYAQRLAITVSAKVYIRFDTQTGKYTLFRDGEKIIKERHLPNVMSVQTNYPQDLFSFNSRGHISRGGRVTFEYGSGEEKTVRQYVIQVGTGRYRLH